MPDGVLDARRAPEALEGAGRAAAMLAHARQAFVEKGFDGASMQDLARAAGMSAGSFYRYFPSKAAIVEALIARDLAEIEAGFQAIAAAPDPLVALKAALRERLTEEGCREEGALWAEICAAGGRKAEVAAALRRMEEAVSGRIALVLGLVHGLPPDEARRRFGAHARLVFLIMHAAMTDAPADEAGEPGLTGLMMRTIDWIVDDALAGKVT